MMSPLTGGAKRHSLVTFFVLTYALSWWPSILYVLDPSPQLVAGFGPFLAAVWCGAAVAVVLWAGLARLCRAGAESSRSLHRECRWQRQLPEREESRRFSGDVPAMIVPFPPERVAARIPAWGPLIGYPLPRQSTGSVPIFRGRACRPALPPGDSRRGGNMGGVDGDSVPRGEPQSAYGTSRIGSAAPFACAPDSL